MIKSSDVKWHFVFFLTDQGYLCYNKKVIVESPLKFLSWYHLYSILIDITTTYHLFSLPTFINLQIVIFKACPDLLTNANLEVFQQN